MPRKKKKDELESWLQNYECWGIVLQGGASECVIFNIMDRLTDKQKEKEIAIKYGAFKVSFISKRISTI